jgi:endonuclease/exonuclease/phosphatase family metal-dependent hydrolase
MIIATWNLNNRVGKKRFRPESADAAIMLSADIIVFTEYYPQSHEKRFCLTLEQAGYKWQMVSRETSEISNRVFIVSKIPLVPMLLELPSFDKQLPSNLLGVELPSIGISVIGVRVPAYKVKTKSLLTKAWDWIEKTSSLFKDSPTIILGDFNLSHMSVRSIGSGHFERILRSGWHRAEPNGGATFFGYNGKKSEIDHIIGTTHCRFSDEEIVMKANGYSLAGSPDSISDHAVLKSRVVFRTFP